MIHGAPDGIRSLPGPDLTPDELTEEQRRALENSSTIVARRRRRPELSDKLLIDVAETYVWDVRDIRHGKYQTARGLLQRRDQRLDHFREMRCLAAKLDTIAERDRTRSRTRGIDYGLEI